MESKFAGLQEHQCTKAIRSQNNYGPLFGEHCPSFLTQIIFWQTFTRTLLC